MIDMPELRRQLQRVGSFKAYVRLQLIRIGRWLYRRALKQTIYGKAIRRQLLQRGYITSTDFEALALSSMAVPSRRIVPQKREVHDADNFPGFNLSAPLNFEISDHLSLYSWVNVLIPSLRLRHMSGGPNTALLLAAYLADRGERVRIISCDAPAEGEEDELYPHIDRLLLRRVDRNRVTLVDGFDRSQRISIGASDVFMATAWWTAQIAQYAVKKTIHQKFIYLIQDFEPIFHPASTFQARAAETYGFSHIPVINTRLLLDHLVKEQIGCYADSQFAKEALYFEPAIDRTRYFASKQPQAGFWKPHVLLFYARPKVALRNLFEMGVVALRRAVEAGCLNKDNWTLYAMGEKIMPIDLGSGVVINPLPWLSLDQYAERVRTADVLLSLMLSPHPSYPPLEMAASGNLVITNSFSVKTKERLRAISPNIIVAEPTIDSITSHLTYGVSRINAGLPSWDPDGVMDLPSDWEESLSAVVGNLKGRIDDLRRLPREQNKYIAEGRPTRALSDYEQYRKARLWERRHAGRYLQVHGLLSFMTSAYNTAPVYLEELACSLFLQDGGTCFEWIILDNGSTDERTRECLNRISRQPYVRLYRVPENLGIIGGMRYCLDRATGRYILPLDSDDVIEPDCVHVLTRFIQEAGFPALLYTDEDKLIADRFVDPYLKPDWDPVLFLHSCYIAHLCAMDREKAIALDLYSDPTAEGCHDWDSFIRFMNAGYVPNHVPEVLYSWRMHQQSTAGNITSKSYITDSHRAVLQKYLNGKDLPHIELVNSPLFQFNVDWWFKRRRGHAFSCTGIHIRRGQDMNVRSVMSEPIKITATEGIPYLAEVIEKVHTDTVHICWDGVVADTDEWLSEAIGLIELFPDTVMVGGILHDGKQVVSGPLVLGFGQGCECPDRGRSLSDPGYGVQMWKQRSVSAVSTGHCVIVTDFLRQALPELVRGKVPIDMLGPWLGGLARERGKRVIFSPFVRAAALTVPEDMAERGSRSRFLSRFWHLLPEKHFYSPCFGLTPKTSYLPVNDQDRIEHLESLQLRTLPYSEWLESELERRSGRYPTSLPAIEVSIMTPVYEGSDLRLLDSLADAIRSQAVQPAEWLLIVNGPMSETSMESLRSKASWWKARLIGTPERIGIVGALRLGLEAAQGEYVLPIDADDLITSDAFQILIHEIRRLGRPDLVYTDEDLLVDGQPMMPYLRGAFDPVLALDNSTIWHLCAMKRSTALNANVYGDVSANWCQDWDSVSRIARYGGSLEHVPMVLYHWRQHSGSTTNNRAGDPRSLDSVRHILERHIAQTSTPERFYVADWPQYRGARELYIARRAEQLPLFFSIDNMEEQEHAFNDNAVLMYAAPGVAIESQNVFVEVARIFDLHPHVGAVGGVVEDSNGMVVDGCYLVNANGMLECPWLRHRVSDAGAYGLALKAQTVAIAGDSLAFFRASALRKVGLCSGSGMVKQLCGRLAAQNLAVAFSPLVRGRAGSSSLTISPNLIRPPKGISLNPGWLARYGLSRNYQLTQ